MVYLGGKKKIAKFIYPIIQKELDSGEYDAYIEPFGGGGNIMENINFPLRYFYDINKYLIAFYNKLKEGWDIPEPNSFNADHYNEVRKSWKEKEQICHILTGDSRKARSPAQRSGESC